MYMYKFVLKLGVLAHMYACMHMPSLQVLAQASSLLRSE